MRDSVSVRAAAKLDPGAAAKLDPGAAAKHDPGTLITLSTILLLTGRETSGTISTAVSTAERERERDMANNYYVHIGSGLVVAADECVTVDLDNLPTEILDQLDGDDYCDDQVLHTYAMTIVDGPNLNE